MTDHEETAERLEREADDMEHRARKVDEDIEAAREDWERKQRDDSVPGAAGEPREEMPPPEPDETD
jgi:hypothetical protein